MLRCNIQTRVSHLCDLSDQYCIYMLRCNIRQESVTSVIYLINTAFTCWGVTSDKIQSPLWFIWSILHLHVECNIRQESVTSVIYLINTAFTCWGVTSRRDSVTSVIYLINTAFTCWGVTSRRESVTSVIYLINTAFTCWGVTSDKIQSPLWFIWSILHLHVEV